MLISALHKWKAGTQRNSLTSCIIPSLTGGRQVPWYLRCVLGSTRPVMRLCLSLLISPLDADARRRGDDNLPAQERGTLYPNSKLDNYRDLLSSPCWPFVHMHRRPPGWPMTRVSRVDSRRFLIALGRFQIGLIFCLVSFCVYTFSLWLRW